MNAQYRNPYSPMRPPSPNASACPPLPRRRSLSAASGSPKTRLNAREETIADRNRRIAEREAARRAAEEREAAELAARQAAEAAAREAERQAREEAQARRLTEHTKREAAETAEREAILAARRAGRKKKRGGLRRRNGSDPASALLFCSAPQRIRDPLILVLRGGRRSSRRPLSATSAPAK